jgi:hypothetical protein
MVPRLEEENLNQPNFSKDSIEEITLIGTKKRRNLNS